MDNLNFSSSKFFLNRELGWLEFNNRVLEEAKDQDNPLFERMKFISIVSSNLDEFFMVRVASLKDQVNVGFDNPDPSGLTPKRQLKRISQRTHSLVEEQYKCLNDNLIPELKANGFHFINKENLSKEDIRFLEEYFINDVYPVLTPMAVDSGRPFPLILSRSLNIGLLVKDFKDLDEEAIFATVQVPSVLPRLIEIPKMENGYRWFILLEEVIDLFLDRLFSGKEILCSFSYRITRNADLSIHEEEAEDLLIEIEKSIKQRIWGTTIRIEVDSRMDDRLIGILNNGLNVHLGEIYYIDGPIDLTFISEVIPEKGYDELKFKEHIQQIPIDLLDEDNIFDTISKRDILLHHPYESFQPIVDFVRKAAKDPSVLAIKQTLYRVSGDSSIVKALAEAAERGKQVTVLVELKARFDERNNINWAKKLEKSGCHVIYGLVGLKTHSKITLVVRREEEKIKRYVHIGTGNYNDITAKLYTDIGLFTCNEYFGADASAIFNMLSGYSEPPAFFKFDVAPLNLRERFYELIENEIENAKQGKKAKIIAKMNALVDPDIISELYKASFYGVKIELIVRGICCLRPGIPKISENITVRSIVGRFLEHSRIYYFYNEGNEKIFISSADLMPRNLNRRVEILCPIEEKRLKKSIKSILKVILNDTVKARKLTSEGIYVSMINEEKFMLNSQDFFSSQANEYINEHENDRFFSGFEPIR